MRRSGITLATAAPLPHNANMGDIHPFTFKIDADPLSKRQFRWTVCEGDQILLRSPHSYRATTIWATSSSFSGGVRRSYFFSRSRELTLVGSNAPSAVNAARIVSAT